MVHITAVINDWKPATLQLFEEGSSCFVEYLLMAASERIKLFTQPIGGKNKVVISETFISSWSHFCWMWIECEVNWNKQIFYSFMLKEPIEVSFFAVQANLHFTDRNFTETKLAKIFSINRNSLSSQNQQLQYLSVYQDYIFFWTFLFFATLWYQMIFFISL